MPDKYRVALTADLYNGDQLLCEDMGLNVLDAQPHLERFNIKEHRSEVGSEQLEGAQGVLVWAPAITASTVSQADDLLAISRIGVGFDKVDVAACSAQDVLVFTTMGAVDRSLAEGTVTFMLALSHNLLIKDRSLRGENFRWTQFDHLGKELRDRTFGAVGLGGIATEAIRLLSIFGMNAPIAYDPYVDAATAMALGVELVSLDQLMRRADFISVHCPLSDSTRGLIGAEQIGQMKSDAYLMNTARGGIVDEDALYDALKHKRIAGAALDVFASEPLTEPPRLAELDNAIITPHAIGMTDELMRDIGAAACQKLVDLSLGRVPEKGLLNPQVLESSGFQQKWQRLRVGG